MTLMHPQGDSWRFFNMLSFLKSSCALKTFCKTDMTCFTFSKPKLKLFSVEFQAANHAAQSVKAAYCVFCVELTSLFGHGATGRVQLLLYLPAWVF